MIRLTSLPPQAALAQALGGKVIGPSTIQLGTHLIVAGPTGVVRVDGARVGRWDDGTRVLAAGVNAVIAGQRVPLVGPVAGEVA